MPLMTGGAHAQGAVHPRLSAGARGIRRCRDRRRRAEEGSAPRQLLGAIARAEETVVANPVESRRPHVSQKAADEFRRGEGQRVGRLRRVGSVILVGEAHLVGLDVAHAIVGDGDPMRVSADIVEDLLRAGDGPFGIDDPVGVPRRSEIACPRDPILERAERP